MKERLPIWFQGMALWLLCSVFAGTLWWTWEYERDTLLYGRSMQPSPVQQAAGGFLVGIAGLITVLGARFVWHIFRDDISWFAILFLFPPLFALLIALATWMR